MTMRSIENTIYFASVNYAVRYQESATSLITPSGECQAFLPYGQERWTGPGVESRRGHRQSRAPIRTRSLSGRVDGLSDKEV